MDVQASPSSFSCASPREVVGHSGSRRGWGVVVTGQEIWVQKGGLSCYQGSVLPQPPHKGPPQE